MRWSLADAAEATGIDVRTLQSYVSGTACPTLAKYYRLERLIGPELGLELARMLGWEPRYARPTEIPFEMLCKLKIAIGEAAERIDDLLELQENPTVFRIVHR